MRKPTLLILGLSFGLLSGFAQADTIADSQADFDPNGEQGTNGWSYGYRLVEDGDDRENYDAEDGFILFEEACFFYMCDCC